MLVPAQTEQFGVLSIYVVFKVTKEFVSVNVNLSCFYMREPAVCIVLSLTCFCTRSAEVTEAVLTPLTT